MKAIKAIGALLSLAVTVAIFAVLNGCFGTPANMKKVGNVQMQAVGAGIVNVQGLKTTIRIKCRACGFEEDRTVDTPVIGTPYMLEWTCPKCGQKQKVTIRGAG
jgi:hypothetical protein